MHSKMMSKFFDTLDDFQVFFKGRLARAVFVMVSPSQANRGFVDDQDCPTLLGKGFGPHCYRALFEMWTTMSSKVDFSSEQQEGVRLLLSRMSNCDGREVNEAVLSGIVASTYQILLHRFSESENTTLCCEHQLCVPSAPQATSSVDIAFTNSLDVDYKQNLLLHSILEVEWDFFDNRFPEIQGTASARLFFEAGSLPRCWVPIFVLSKTHFRFGVAFQLRAARWAYSEIHDFRKGVSFSPGESADVLALCRFSLFMVKSAAYHQSYAGTEDQHLLVDINGSKIFKENIEIIDDRVLKGTAPDDSEKILKFYADRGSAEKAIDNQRKLGSALGFETKADLIVGCGDGMCAVMNPYLTLEPTITRNHLKKLTEIVSILYDQKLLYGDLRPQNIIFGLNDAVHLIDFDWAESFGVAKFPANVNRTAFGKRAISFVKPDLLIPSKFDWWCLSDILCTDGNSKSDFLARAISVCNKAAIMEALDSLTSQEEAQILKNLYSEPPAKVVLNLGRLSSRIANYFRLSSTSSHNDENQEGCEKARKRPRTSLGSLPSK